ncbi:MAG: hypothetical protein IPM30_04330 [Burkholderiales bacterium]|nr:hypothetical protein [Burkholderiales bacterium]
MSEKAIATDEHGFKGMSTTAFVLRNLRGAAGRARPAHPLNEKSVFIRVHPWHITSLS